MNKININDGLSIGAGDMGDIFKGAEDNIAYNKMLAKLKKLQTEYSESVVNGIKDSASEKYSGVDIGTDEELYQKAVQSLKDVRDNKIAALNSTADKKVTNVNGKIEDTSDNLNKAMNSLNKKYAILKDENLDSMVKKGLSRSSIAKLTNEKLDNDLTENVQDEVRSAEIKLARLNTELEQNEADRQLALENYEISYAASLSSKIASLTSERNALQSKLDAGTTDWDKYLETELSRIQAEDTSYEKENGDFKDEKKENYLDRYDAAYEYYSSMSKDKALSYIKKNKDELTDLLGIYYDKLIAAIKEE